MHVFAGSSTDEFTKQVHAEKVNQLTQIFPAHEVTFLKEILEKSGSVDDAVAGTCRNIIFLLLDMGLWGRTTASLSKTIKADSTCFFKQ